MNRRIPIGKQWRQIAVGWGLAVATLSWTTAVVAAPNGPPPAQVRTDTVDTQVLGSRWEVVGRLREVRRSVVASEQAGRVMQTHVEEGQAVIGGQSTLAVIDDTWARLALKTAQAKVAQATAGVAVAKARLDQAVRDRQYLIELLKSGSAKPKEAEDAQTTQRAQQAILQLALADLQEANSGVERASQQVAKLKIIAPFDGIVVRKATEIGQWVNPGDPVVEIISSQQIDAVIDVPEHLINMLRVDENIEVVVEAIGVEAVGQIVAVNPLGSSVARTFPVKIRLDDLGGRLKAGMSVLARVPTSQSAKVLLIPRDALSRSEKGDVVWADVNGSAVPIAVRVLFGHEDHYAVEPIGATLIKGAHVVIEGAERLIPGQPLRVMPDPTGQDVGK